MLNKAFKNEKYFNVIWKFQDYYPPMSLQMQHFDCPFALFLKFLKELEFRLCSNALDISAN